jgi:hypothetical protein
LVEYMSVSLLHRSASVKWLSTLLPVSVVANISVTCALSIENYIATMR